MQIDQITITNFKLFKQSEFRFHPSFNLVIGTNGSGKTSLLRAVAVALGGWAHAYIKKDSNRRPISDEEKREIPIDKRFEKSKTVVVEARGTAAIVDHFANFKTGKAIWRRKRVEDKNQTLIDGEIDYGNGKYYNLNFEVLGADILSYIEGGRSFDLPILAFYECDRLWLPKEEINPEAAAVIRHSRFDPYLDCFHTGADHKSLGQWLLKHELASNQQKIDTPILKSIREAAKAALDGCSDLRFDFDESRIMVEYTDGRTIPFDHLSDGQRTMLGLFCDIARRAALLNPHFGGEASAKTAGVVLIDELDLHLHPQWQRRIIHDLRRTFPKIQFICTTHSPQLIGQAKPEEIIVLDAESGHPSQSLGMDSNWILRHIMGSDDRDPEVALQLDTIFSLVEKSSFEEAQIAVNTLRSKIGEHPDLVEAQALISRYNRFDASPTE